MTKYIGTRSDGVKDKHDFSEEIDENKYATRTGYKGSLPSARVSLYLIKDAELAKMKINTFKGRGNIVVNNED